MKKEIAKLESKLIEESYKEDFDNEYDGYYFRITNTDGIFHISIMDESYDEVYENTYIRNNTEYDWNFDNMVDIAKARIDKKYFKKG